MQGWMQQEHARASSLLFRCGSRRPWGKILAHQAPPPCHLATCRQGEAAIRRDLDGRPPPVWRWEAHCFASRQQDEAIWSSISEAEGGKPRRGSAFKGTGARYQDQWSASMDQVTSPNAGVVSRGSLCVAYAHRCVQIYSKCAYVLQHQNHRTHYVIDQAIIFLWRVSKKANTATVKKNTHTQNTLPIHTCYDFGHSD